MDVTVYERCEDAHPEGALLWYGECAEIEAGPQPNPSFTRGDLVRVEPSVRTPETDLYIERFGVVDLTFMSIHGTHASPDRSPTDRPTWGETLSVRLIPSLQERPFSKIVLWCGHTGDVALYVAEGGDPVDIEARLITLRDLMLAEDPVTTL